MKFTNFDIYNYGQQVNGMFTNKDLYLPAKVNFFLQKNIQTMINAAEEIEKSRIEIVRHYGVPNEETGSIEVPVELTAVATAEIQDLFNLEQELNITPINIEKFGNIELTLEQMNAIMFMIEGD